jgi:hypothetical protein
VRLRAHGLFVLVFMLGACEGDEPRPSAEATTTTAALTGPSVSVWTTPTTAAGPLPPEFGRGAYVEGEGRWLTAPDQTVTKTVTPSCAGLYDEGWQADCHRFDSRLGDAEVVYQRKGVEEQVLIYVHRGATSAELALRAADKDGAGFDATVDAVDLAGDGIPRILVKMRAVDPDPADGVDPPLQADVVEPNGKIVVHLNLWAGRSGTADVRPVANQGLEVLDCPGDCVPTAPLRRRLIAWRDGAWRVVSEGFGRP